MKNPALKGRINPLFVPMVMPNAGAAALSLRRGFRGPCMSVSTVCAAGANAIGEGMRLLREGSADVVVCGGAEAPLTPWVMTAFAAADALSERADDPLVGRGPFDRDRDGFVMGEGAAVVVLERLDAARARARQFAPSCSGTGATPTRIIRHPHHPTAAAPSTACDLRLPTRGSSRPRSCT